MRWLRRWLSACPCGLRSKAEVHTADLHAVVCTGCGLPTEVLA